MGEGGVQTGEVVNEERHTVTTLWARYIAIFAPPPPLPPSRGAKRELLHQSRSLSQCTTPNIPTRCKPNCGTALPSSPP